MRCLAKEGVTRGALEWQQLAAVVAQVPAAAQELEAGELGGSKPSSKSSSKRSSRGEQDGSKSSGKSSQQAVWAKRRRRRSCRPSRRYLAARVCGVLVKRETKGDKERG